MIFEICNEPNGNTTWAQIKQYATAVIPAIRKYSNAVIIVGTPTWSQDVDAAAKSPLSQFKNVMYAFHFYAATHGATLRAKLQTALDAKLPVFVSEFGVSEASGTGKIDLTSGDQWLNYFDQHHLSYTMWSFSNKDESSAMIKSTVTKTSGFTSADLTPAGNWYLKRLAKDASNTSSQNAATDSSKSHNATDSQETTKSSTSNTSATNQGLTVTQVKSWQTNDATQTQLGVAYNNTAKKTASGWQIKLVFKQAVTVKDHWNCNFSVKNKTVTLTPVDYNQKLTADQSLKDIGLIVQADQVAQVSTQTISLK